MLLICDKCPLLRIYENKTKTRLLSLVRFDCSVLFCLFVFFFFAIAKIVTREIWLTIDYLRN